MKGGPCVSLSCFLSPCLLPRRARGPPPSRPPPHFLPPTPGVAFKKVALTPDDNSNIPMYPCIGLRTPGEEVEANFGSEPFVFDIASIIEVRSPWRA